MIKCADDCLAACDYCRHYNFNGEPVQSLDGTQTIMVYVGNGQCKHPDHPAQQDPGAYCEDFHCGMSKEVKAAARA